MRRKDREITEREEIIEILKKLDTVRIGMYGKEYPYVVPVSFGMEIEDGMPVIYFHCAKQGMKYDRICEDSRICVEGDHFMGVQKTAYGITTRFESVIGFGTCTFLEDQDEKIHGLKLILEHYGRTDYPLDRCKGLKNLYIGKISLESITGKHNLPETEFTDDLHINGVH